MNRLLRAIVLLALAVALPGPAAAQTDAAGAVDPALRANLVPDQAMVPANHEILLRLLLDVQRDTEIPGELLTGVRLDSSVDDQPGPQVREGEARGPVAVAAGTRIERRLTLPVARLLPAGGATGLAHVSVQWPGLLGANCVFQVVPDLSKVDVDQLDLMKTRVVLVTDHGEMTVEFYPQHAPETVRNFVKLAKEGFYDGTRFHRVIRNFMIQGGDPLTKDEGKRKEWGKGGPGYSIRGEVNETRHVRGVISMANSTGPDTAGSQFFICHKDQPQLDGKYTAFGALAGGLDVLDSIASVECGGPERSAPLDDIVLRQAVVVPVMKNREQGR